MTRMTNSAATLAVAAFAIAAPCEAQRSTARVAPSRDNVRDVASDERPSGFMLGVRTVGALGLKMDMEESTSTYDTKFGTGAGVIVGYGVNGTFSAFASLDLAKQNTAPGEAVQGSWGLADFALGARANLPFGGARTVPYALASFGRRALAARATDEDGQVSDATISGTAITVGGGIEHAISRTMWLDGGIDVGYGKLDHLKEDADQWTQKVSATKSIRMRLGVTWRPGSKRS
jgi:hypothetical protein